MPVDMCSMGYGSTDIMSKSFKKIGISSQLDETEDDMLLNDSDASNGDTQVEDICDCSSDSD